MAKIQIMDEILANKIAAGEVVERCSSVVKELVENSIDANSTEIKVELIESGTKSIIVTDNGNGMESEDALLAFQRHATSKLKTEYDLFHINTLGFRGEALPSIASVSDVYLKTSTGKVGTEIHIKGGKLIEQKPSEARKGTEIKINDLFFNTPARLKHMKSLYTELANVTDYMNKIALSHPDIKFILINNGSILLNTEGKGDLLKTINSIYGIDITRKMKTLETKNEDYKITGYISLPEVHRSNRNGMIVIVNGRVVRNTELNRVINDAYHSYKPDNRYPIVVLNIEVDPSLIDVNIHPTKMDIKFSKFESLCNLIEKSIKEKLDNKNLIPKIDLNKEHKKIEEIKIDFSSIYKPIDLVVSDNIEKELIINEDYINEEIEDIKEDVEKNEKEYLPELYPVGLVHGTYIICQNDLGMYLIDQHAAKERINYEHVLEELSHPKGTSQPMLFPINIEFTNNEYIIIKENLDVLRNMDFEVEEFGINSLIFKSHPLWLPKDREEEAIRKIIEVVLACEKNFSLSKFNDHVAATIACKMSIKANTNITHEEMERLIEDLNKCNNPYNCPHGRPTIIFYSKSDLEKQFKRSGF